MADNKRAWSAIPSGVIPYGDTRAQQYNVTSGAPVGKPTYMDQLAAFGTTKPAAPKVAAYTGAPAPGYVPRDTYGRSATPYTGNVPRDTYRTAIPAADINGAVFAPGGVNTFGQSPESLGAFASNTWGTNQAAPTMFGTDPTYGGGSFPTGDNALAIGGTGYTPSTGLNFVSRQPNQSAGVAGISDYMEGAGKSFGEGDFTGGLGSLWDGAKNAFSDTGFLGKTENGVKTDGWGGLALGAANGLMSGYMGMKQYGLARDSFDESKRQFAVNYDAQKKTTNNDMRLQAERRHSERPDKYATADAYMKLNGIA